MFALQSEIKLRFEKGLRERNFDKHSLLFDHWAAGGSGVVADAKTSFWWHLVIAGRYADIKDIFVIASEF
jgi:hypothetical protein